MPRSGRRPRLGDLHFDGLRVNFIRYELVDEAKSTGKVSATIAISALSRRYLWRFDTYLSANEQAYVNERMIRSAKKLATRMPEIFSVMKAVGQWYITGRYA